MAQEQTLQSLARSATEMTFCYDDGVSLSAGLIMEDQNRNKVPLWGAIAPIAALIIFLTINVRIFEDATAGANQMVLLLSAAIAGVFGRIFGVPVASMMKGIVKSIAATTPAILVLLTIGALAGTWMISGIVPAMVYYGLKVISPQWFLVASVVVCGIVSVATGSSWSTIATVGVALIGIGQSLGIPAAMAAGAVISGAYFGDKVSPLSDTTNLAAAMAGAELFTHIRHMLWTTVPSIVIALVVFGYLGAGYQSDLDPKVGPELSQVIEAKFNLTPWLLVVPLAVLVMVMLKIDAVVALLTGAVLGALAAVLFQPDIVRAVAGDSGNYLRDAYVTCITALSSDVQLVTDHDAADELLNSSGMAGMLNTIWLILCAMCFGGVMEACGMLRRLTEPMVHAAKSSGALITSTAGTCLFLNLTASDQYLAIVVPGRMFRESFEDRELAAENLSRTLEDAGTVTSVLVPWNTCGAMQASVLSVPVMAFAPWCIFNYVSPVMTIAFGWLGWTIKKRETRKV